MTWAKKERVIKAREEGMQIKQICQRFKINEHSVRFWIKQEIPHLYLECPKVRLSWKAFNMKKSGLTPMDIARELGVSEGTVHEAIALGEQTQSGRTSGVSREESDRRIAKMKAEYDATDWDQIFKDEEKNNVER